MIPDPKPSVTARAAPKKASLAVLWSPAMLKWAVVLLPLAYFWFRTIDNLQMNWRTNPQYSYGLLVPFLCIGLLVFRWHAVRSATESRKQKAENRKRPGEAAAHSTGQGPGEVAMHSTGQGEPGGVGTRFTGQGDKTEFQLSAFPISDFKEGPWSAVLLFAFLALLYLPTRLLEAAVPIWNPIQWLLAIEAVGLTLCVVWLGMGRGWLRQLAFPICFFLVAVPWPTFVEQPIIQTLTRVSAAIVVDVLGVFGVPALTHGNVIEVSTGMVGIDEACSGIRSFQSSLMISLFFGEFYRLSQGRRWLLLPLGFFFSMLFNICRMTFLTWIAADKGVNAISEFHDPAGITIAILCTFALWGLAALLRKPKAKGRREKSEDRDQRSEVGGHPPPQGYGATREAEEGNQTPNSELRTPNSKIPGLASTFRLSTLNRLMLCLVVWVVAVEVGIQLWYHHLDSRLRPGPAWTLAFPVNNPTFKSIPIDEATRYLLRYDQGKQGSWTAANGTQWQAFYFTWQPGRVAGYLAKRHTPEICLTAEGLKMLSGPKLTMMNIHGVVLPMRCYVFQTAAGRAQVFQCRWDAGAQEDDYVAHESARYNLIRAIWAGRGDKGQKVLEFVITGMDDPVRAKQALVRELDKLIEVEGPGLKAESRKHG